MGSLPPIKLLCPSNVREILLLASLIFHPSFRSVVILRTRWDAASCCRCLTYHRETPEYFASTLLTEVSWPWPSMSGGFVVWIDATIYIWSWDGFVCKNWRCTEFGVFVQWCRVPQGVDAHVLALPLVEGWWHSIRSDVKAAGLEDIAFILVSHAALVHFNCLLFSDSVSSDFTFASTPKILQCLSIYWTLLLNMRPAPTSWSDLCNLPTPSSWILSARDASKLPLYSAMRKQWCCVGTVILCSASPPAVRLV